MTFRQQSLLFPPAKIGVVGPRGDREGFLLGLTMFTASRSRIVHAHVASYHVARLLGPRALPARRTELVLDDWDELVASTDGLLDHVASVATYLRRDPRAGRTMLARRLDGRAVLLKTRTTSEGLTREQQMLSLLQGSPLPGIAVPPPLGLGSTPSGLTWSAQGFVFHRPHRPVFRLADAQLAALAGTFKDVAADLGLPRGAAGLEPAHRDLSPWNLRQDHQGRVWLLDWEDVGMAPRGADGAYLDLTSAAVRGTKPARMPSDVVRYWTAVLEERVAAGHEQTINGVMLQHLRDLP